MTVAHFYSSVVVGTFAQTGVVFGESFFNRITGLCTFIGSTCVVACQNGFFTSCLLALNRFYLIYISFSYNHIFIKL